MDYKTPIIKSLSIVILTLFSSSIIAQECVIEKIPDKFFYFNKSGLVTQKYESMKTKDSSSYQIMLINFLGFSNRIECHYLAIDTNNIFKISVVTKDSVLFSGCNLKLNRNSWESFKKVNQLNGFLYSKCQNIISSYNKQVLVICNNSKNMWLEYLSFDGHLEDALNSNPAFSSLKEVYMSIKEVFKNFKFPLELK